MLDYVMYHLMMCQCVQLPVILFAFLPRSAMRGTVYTVTRCLFVCLSVHRHHALVSCQKWL